MRRAGVRTATVLAPGYAEAWANLATIHAGAAMSLRKPPRWPN